MINIVLNTAIDYIKSKGFRNDIQNQSVTDFVYDIKEDADTKITDYIGFTKVLEQLDPDKRELIYLACFQAYTQVEIS